MKRLRYIFLSGALLFLSACSSRGLYNWGSYDDSIERMYNTTSFELDQEIEDLSTELEQTKPEKIPPGKAAHVGYLYSLKGDSRMSRHFFELEKKLFPESTVFMNGLIKRGVSLPQGGK